MALGSEAPGGSSVVDSAIVAKSDPVGCEASKARRLSTDSISVWIDGRCSDFLAVTVRG